MKGNTKTWLLMLVLLPLICGVYGILHDQITYSISSEYFRHFKFVQFNLDENLRDYERLAAAAVGFLSTWWVGIILGVPLGIIGFRKMDSKQYRKSRIQSVKLLFLVTVIFGMIGYFAGLYFVWSTADWPMTVVGRSGNSELLIAFAKIRDWDHFIIVGRIHNYSYFGALVGLVTALIKQYRVLRRLS